MKRYFLNSLLILSLTIGVSSCGNKNDRSGQQELPAKLVTNPGSSTGQASTASAQISFVKDEHDFGIIKEGEKVFWNFKFTNTGTIPLIINRVKTDCGCTAPDYPKTPIAPGEEGRIKVTFDTKGRLGKQIKRITVLSNSERPTNVLSIVALVEK